MNRLGVKPRGIRLVPPVNVVYRNIEGHVRSKHNKKLVVTDARVFSVKKGLMRRASEDYSLNDISSIQFSKGIRKSKICLQGTGIDDEYPARKSHGETFVAAVRKQINH